MDLLGSAFPQQEVRGGSTVARQRFRAKPGVGRKW